MSAAFRYGVGSGEGAGSHLPPTPWDPPPRTGAGWTSSVMEALRTRHRSTQSTSESASGRRLKRLKRLRQ